MLALLSGAMPDTNYKILIASIYIARCCTSAGLQFAIATAHNFSESLSTIACGRRGGSHEAFMAGLSLPNLVDPEVLNVLSLRIGLGFLATRPLRTPPLGFPRA